MNRYYYTEKQKNRNALKKTIYPNFDGSNFFYIDVNAMNRIDKLAYRYYGDSSLYWFIILTNNLDADSLIIKSNMKLKIFNNINNELIKMRG